MTKNDKVRTAAIEKGVEKAAVEKAMEQAMKGDFTALESLGFKVCKTKRVH